MKKLHSLVDAFGEVDVKTVDAYLAELDVTARLRHPSIVLLQAAVLDPAGLCVVLECVWGDGLFHRPSVSRDPCAAWR